MTVENEIPLNQKQGVINQCPNCGGTLAAFSSRCELCGHELAGIAANRTVADLAERLAGVETALLQAGVKGRRFDKELVSRRARLIRDFPIPNSREDLQSLIYFIHPKIHDHLTPDPNAEDWRVKFTEVLNLAKNAYKGDAKTRAEFEEIERSLNTTVSAALHTRAKRYPVVAAGLIVVAVLAIAGIAVTQYENWSRQQCENKFVEGARREQSRLDQIVVLAAAKQAEGRYADAQTALNGLHWNYQETCKLDEAARQQTKWEDKRKDLLAQVDQAKAAEIQQKQAAAQRAEEEKRAAAERANEEKRVAAERELAGKMTHREKEAATARKASTNREW